MAKRDYYEILGVDRNADEKELKSAFRKQAMKYHPDKNSGDKQAEQKFKEIGEAYTALKDPQKRAAYDQFGHAAFEGGKGGPGGGFGSEFSGSMSSFFEDLFGDSMGGGRRSRGGGGVRGSDVRYDMQIDLTEAYTGKKTEIRVPTSATCDTCNGSGAKPGTEPSTCATCGGHGKVHASQGFFTIERTCHVCGGRGQVIQDLCPTCHGQGRVQKNQTLAIDIPAGVEDGNRIRLSGKGEAGLRGGPPGDLYIFLTVTPHEFFQRDGHDLFCRVPIAITTASLGGSIEVPLIDGGRSRVKVPEGTQSTRQLRLRGKGMPQMRRQGYGDMYIQLQVETPVKLSKRQKELLQEFEKQSCDANNPQASHFFTKVKEFWNGMSK